MRLVLMITDIGQFEQTTGTDNWNSLKRSLLSDADDDNSDEGISILRDIYLHPEEVGKTTREGIRIANDREAMDWIRDFWSYHTWILEDDPPHLSEIGFDGFVDSIVRPDVVLEILVPEGSRISECDPDALDLYNRLIRLNRRYTIFQKKSKGRK